MCGIYLWQNNTCQSLKNLHIYFKTRTLWMEFLGEPFMVYDIDIHELNQGPFKYLKFSDEISFKKWVFFAFLNNNCIIISSF